MENLKLSSIKIREFEKELKSEKDRRAKLEKDVKLIKDQMKTI